MSSLAPTTSWTDVKMDKMSDRSGISYFEMVQYARELLAGNDISDAEADAWYLMAYVTGMSRTDYLLRRREPMIPGQQEAYQMLVQKRASHIPLQHLTGEQEFMGFSFLVNEHVLVPRQDTEILVEETMECLKRLERDRKGQEALLVLDLCTGSGCIAVSLKKLCPWIHMEASDLSPEALAVARENGRRNGAEIAWQEGDLFEPLKNKYDVIVSNPPYIPTAVIDTLSEEVRDHEPHQALDGHADGLYFYRKITEEAGSRLNPGGWLYFEIGYDQGEAVSELMRQGGFSQIRVTRDLAGLDRVVSGQYG